MIGAASIARIREQYADEVTAGASSPAVRDAFAKVPRERFLGPGPWKILQPDGNYAKTPNGDPAHVYRDVLVALDAEAGLNNGQPSLHAVCLGALDLRKGETVVHVGCGSGYYTAIIAELVGPDAIVQGWEIEPALAEIAEENLALWPNVTVVPLSATEGPLPPADAVYVSAGATTPVRVWTDALLSDGRLLFPLVSNSGRGGMLLVTRRPAGLAARFVTGAQFIPCTGAQNPKDGKALEAAFLRGGWAEVRSLHFGTRPDDSAWVSGKGWWLSTAYVE
jgi:protein-L-isoaspartate(D-aspartate) O-methyltransferase